MKKIVGVITDWLSAKDIDGDLGANLLVSFIRYILLFVIFVFIGMLIIEMR